MESEKEKSERLDKPEKVAIKIQRCPRCEEILKPEADMYFKVSSPDEDALLHLEKSDFFKDKIEVQTSLEFCLPCQKIVGKISVEKFLAISGKKFKFAHSRD